MSYFCANSISINKADNTCTVTGGDNNVFPRSNEKSRPFPLRSLVYELDGGMIQFTSRTDKNVHIDHLARETSKRLEVLTGFNAYELGTVISGKKSIEDMENGYFEAIAYYQSDDCHMSEDYKSDEIIKGQRILDIIHDDVLMAKINIIMDDFVEQIKKPLPKTKFLIQFPSGMFMYKKLRRSCTTTSNRDAAQRFSEARAREIIVNYSDRGAEVIAA